MSRAGLALRALCLALVSLTAVSLSQPLVGRAEAADEVDARALLARAVHAARDLAYSGTQYVVAMPGTGTASAVMEVQHLPGRGSQIHVRETPEAPDARIFDADPSSLVDLDATALDVLARRYRLATSAEAATVVGRSADVVTASRRDGSVAGRFWVDHETGLLLRREVLDKTGRLVRSSAFVDLAIGPKAQLRSVDAEPPTNAVPSPWSRRLPLSEAANLGAEGWHVPTQLSGGGGADGKPAGSAAGSADGSADGSMELFDIRIGATRSGDEIVHLSYTDGLSTLSIFEQRGRLDDGGMPGWHPTSVAGKRVWTTGTAPEQIAWSGRTMVYTVLADATPEQLDSAVTSLPHSSQDHGLWHRLVGGLKKIGSWLNPFD